MRAKNIHETPFNLESGECLPGETAEFTGAEYMFLAKMGRAEIVTDEVQEEVPDEDQDDVPEVRPLTPAEKGAATKAAKAAKKAEEEKGFM